MPYIIIIIFAHPVYVYMCIRVHTVGDTGGGIAEVIYFRIRRKSLPVNMVLYFVCICPTYMYILF